MCFWLLRPAIGLKSTSIDLKSFNDFEKNVWLVGLLELSKGSELCLTMTVTQSCLLKAQKSVKGLNSVDETPQKRKIGAPEL